MAERPIISYDDITLPYDQPQTQNHATSSQPPPKKRKKNNQKGKHWDGPSRSNAPKSASNSQRAEFLRHANSSNSEQPHQQYQLQEEEEEWDAEAQEGEYEEDESRELTHQEIWDDSALVDAWNSAMEEYRAYNGPEKDWKNEPVKKSPLWYNIPVDPSKKTAAKTTVVSSPAAGPEISVEFNTNVAEEDSQPINFDTFVPTHDASLDNPRSTVSAMDYASDVPAGSMVSQDEAFSRALSAMYWGGYWTAMYHAQRHYAPTATGTPTPLVPANDADDTNEYDGDEIEIDDVDDNEFVSTQR